MKAILVIFDSLSRKYLPSYGCDWVEAENFNRLSKESVTFDKCFVGSMPCMPARRELHTGRYNFLHRSWGPLEPFDDSMPQILKENGVVNHLISDHYHYWQDGGSTYHNRYSSWENVRGQEGDAWKCEIKDPEEPEAAGLSMRQDWINRKYMRPEENMSQTKTFDLAMEFLDKNANEDNWFLQVECFDPHPPFFAPERFREKYKDNYKGPHFDWPDYREISEDETPEMIEHCQREYASLVSMCDYSLGRVIDYMDKGDMWKDTMLIVTTDHGFCLENIIHGVSATILFMTKCALNHYSSGIPAVRERGSAVMNWSRPTICRLLFLNISMLTFLKICRAKRCARLSQITSQSETHVFLEHSADM